MAEVAKGPNLDKDKVKEFEKGFREATGAEPRETPSPSPKEPKEKKDIK